MPEAKLIFVRMTFPLARFEQHVHESVLKKGLRLFEAGAVKPLSEHNRQDLVFRVKTHDVVLALTGKLVDFTKCSCRRVQPCEHCCACFFYVQQEALQLMKSPVKKKSFSHPLFHVKKARKVSSLLKAISPTADLSAGLKAMEEEHVFAFYYHAMQAVLKEFEGEEILNQHQLTAIRTKVDDFVQRVKNTLPPPVHVLALNLAMVVHLNALRLKRLSGDETWLLHTTKQCEETLSNMAGKTLSDTETQHWKHAVFLSVNNNRSLTVQPFLFLIRYAVLFLRREEAKELLQILDARRYKRRYHEETDPLACARFFVRVRLAEPKTLELPKPDEPNWLEALMALTEYELLKHKSNKAVHRLTTLMEQPQSIAGVPRAAFLAFALNVARASRSKALERQVLLQRFLTESFLQQQDLERYAGCLEPSEREAALRALCEQLSVRNRYFVFEKMSLALIFTNQYPRLAAELKKEHKRLSLAQETALHLEEDLAIAFMPTYLRHLAEALNEARVFSLQKNLLDKSLRVFDRFGADKRDNFLSRLGNSLGENSALNHYLRSIQ